MNPEVKIRRLRADAIVPKYQTAQAAGLDLHASIGEALTIESGARTSIGTGLAFALPAGFEGQIRPRSGLARDHGVTLVNSPGTLDADYTGELIVLVINHGAKAVAIKPGDRIAQLVIAPVSRAELTVVDELPTTARGDGGFGSTGR